MGSIVDATEIIDKSEMKFHKRRGKVALYDKIRDDFDPARQALRVRATEDKSDDAPMVKTVQNAAYTMARELGMTAQTSYVKDEGYVYVQFVDKE